MNILFLTISRINGLEERGIYTDLMREFIRNGHAMYIVSPYERRFHQPTGVMENGGARILKVKTLNIQKTNIVEKGIGTLLLESQYLHAINKYWRDVKFDLILYSTPPITFNKVIRTLKKRWNAKTYLMLKDIFPQNAVDLGMFSKKSFLYRMFRSKEEKLYELSDFIGCMSPANCEYVLKHNPAIDAAKVEICPNSVKLQERLKGDRKESELLKELNIPASKRIFIYGGNLGKPQGIDFLLKVIEEYGIYFVDRDYWNVFQFEFVQGHFFTEGEMQMPCVIVNENFVRSFFPDKSVINKEIQIEGNTYRITGVVADVSYFAPQGKASLWVPEKFSKNESNDWVETYILYPENMEAETMVRSVTNAYQFFVKTYYNIDKSVSVKQISTEKQFIRKMYGGGLFLSGVGVMVFILLVVPVLNIVLLSMANTNVQTREIGLKRALGASKRTSFLFILVENLLLVITGTVLGILLTVPVCRGIDWIVFSNSIEGQMMLLPRLNWTIIFISVLPLALLFSFLSGGIPAYLTVKRPIVDMLKGGTK